MGVACVRGVLACCLLVMAFGCAEENPSSESANPFLADYPEEGKADTQYLNPDGFEIEVDIEANVQASARQIFDAPANQAQFALTYLRRGEVLYLESLAELATSDERVEWLVNGAWITAADARSVDTAKLTRFRIRGMNAVLLHQSARGVDEGDTWEVPVPPNPYTVMQLAGATCAEEDDHMKLDASIYWYLWNPDLNGCKLATETMTITVSRRLPTPPTVYPEYDQLVADGVVTAVLMFGQIDDNLTNRDPNVRAAKDMAAWLDEAGFAEVKPAPVGRRFSKPVGSVDFVIDVYSPYDFAGLDDTDHFDNFQRAISEHEIVVYDGHSMLGSSDFWSRPKYPEFYQIYLYGGCLGYEYYIQPILEGKGGWERLDLMSSVVEVTAGSAEFAAPVLAKIAYALSHNYNVSWNNILRTVRDTVGDSTFGLSGVRENVFRP